MSNSRPPILQLRPAVWLRRALSWALALAATSLACATLGPLRTTDCRPAAALCTTVFPQTTWRALHEIDVAAPFGKKTSLLGLTFGDPVAHRLRAVLMTVEGFVLFDAAVEGERVRVFRALPPFDAPAFAVGLLTDVQAMFFAPTGPLIADGCLPDGRPACRYAANDRGLVEIAVAADGARTLRAFDAARRLVREIDFSAPGVNGVSPAVAIRSPGALGYSLNLRLLEFESGLSVDAAFAP